MTTEKNGEKKKRQQAGAELSQAQTSLSKLELFLIINKTMICFYVLSFWFDIDRNGKIKKIA